MTAESMLFTPFKIKGLTLKNRVTMPPVYLGYGAPDGTVSPLMIDHYREMAASGAGLIVVENCVVEPAGLGSPWTLRIDHDGFISGLAGLARAIKDEGAYAFLQLNHTGRYAFMPDKMTPSPIKVGETLTREMTVEDIDRVVEAFAAGAGRVREAGFDGVEIHGGTGYLLVQFLSHRTNSRTDAYGGSLENRMRFPLRVVDAVKARTGGEFPVGYRFLADEGVPDGLHPDDTSPLAVELEKRNIAYLSVQAESYDAFARPEFMARARQEAYMADFAGIIKKVAVRTPVIAAGRIKTPEIAERLLRENTADLVGLGRVLFADPLWVKKAAGEIKEPIIHCEPTCSLCMQRIMTGKPAICSQWSREKRDALLEKTGEKKKEN